MKILEKYEESVYEDLFPPKYAPAQSHNNLNSKKHYCQISNEKLRKRAKPHATAVHALI